MKLRYFLFFLFIFASCCYAGNKHIGQTSGKYNLLLNPDKQTLKEPALTDAQETLFILDYSNSMNEMLYSTTKYEMLLESMRILLANISSKNRIGVRLYGQRWGFTPLDACKATTLAVPVGFNSKTTVSTALEKYSPRGMTPITYSLKQAVKKDFKTSGDKHIILITDGGENCDESPCKYAMELIKYRKDITIDVIAFNIDNDYDLDQLECVAKVTKGKLYQADTKAELVNSLNNAFKAKREVNATIIK